MKTFVIIAAFLIWQSQACNKKSDKALQTSPKNTTIPSAPTDVKAELKQNFIEISWETAEHASAYNVYWSANEGVTENSNKMERITGTVAKHRNLSPKATYYYRVTAIGPGGESELSQEVSEKASR